jgi:transposase
LADRLESGGRSGHDSRRRSVWWQQPRLGGLTKQLKRAAFPHLCGVSPLEAGSGKNQRHRLNRSGDPQADSALWHIVITRMVYDPRTSEYIERRTKEGKTMKEAVRRLKRYVAREVCGLLPHGKLGVDNP